MPDPTALPVTVQGATWTTYFTGGSFLMLLGLLIRQIGPWRKQASDEQQLLITNLNETIGKLSSRLDAVERQLGTERKMHFIEIRRLDARNAAQRSLDRHKFANREQCLDSLLRILELSPDKAPEAARLAREQILEQRKGEQLESAEIHKAEMAAVASAERELAIEEDKTHVTD